MGWFIYSLFCSFLLNIISYLFHIIRQVDCLSFFLGENMENLDNLYKTDLKNGLSSNEALKRLEANGYNELRKKKKTSFIKYFFSELDNPMIYVLLACVLLTLIASSYDTYIWLKKGEEFNFFTVGDWPDICIILLVIIINSFIGAACQKRSEVSLEALKKISPLEVYVIRDGKRCKILARNLCIGDIVLLEEGNTVGADLRLIESVNLKINESSLTGESVPVLKNANFLSSGLQSFDKLEYAYMGTNVVSGRGKGVVVSCGMDTEIGVIAASLDDKKEATPLELSLAHLSKILGFITIILVLIVFIMELVWMYIDKNLSIANSFECILSATSLAVAAIPEGLPAVVTIVLATGVKRMVKANTIVRKLSSVETLGAVSVICSDKTGTLTENKMTVVDGYANGMYFKEKRDFKKMAIGMALCNNASIDDGVFGDPMEIALLEYAKGLNLDYKDYLRLDEKSFDSDRKMMSVLCKLNDEYIVYTKGAIDRIINNCKFILEHNMVRKIYKEDILKIEAANTAFAKRALRVLALAYTKSNKIEEHDMIFVGMLAMMDPPRKEVKDSVGILKAAGIKTVMITGDHVETAFAVGKMLDICKDKDECITGSEIDKLSPSELINIVGEKCVFARVSPKNKADIVLAYQKNGNVCAMTGDGINDAISLRTADIGISMGLSGTDVAREASDMILTDDNFSSIELAVEEGRSIYSNIRRTIIFLLGSNLAEVLAMLILIVIGLPLPLMPIHLLWVNLITDSLPAIALGMQPKSNEEMKKKPRGKNDKIFSGGGLKLTVIYSIIITIAVIVSYLSEGFIHGARSVSDFFNIYDDSTILLKAQTMAFTTLGIAELFHMIGMSDLNNSFINVFKVKNKMLFLSFVLGIILQLCVIEIPFLALVFTTCSLNIVEWLIVVLCSISPLIAHEIIYICKK